MFQDTYLTFFRNSLLNSNSIIPNYLCNIFCTLLYMFLSIFITEPGCIRSAFAQVFFIRIYAGVFVHTACMGITWDLIYVRHFLFQSLEVVGLLNKVGPIDIVTSRYLTWRIVSVSLCDFQYWCYIHSL